MNDDSMSKRIVPVLVPMPVDRVFSYVLSNDMNVEPGSIVAVPLGSRTVAGVVWEGNGEAVDARKLRSIEHVFDCPPLKEGTRRFIDWIASYTITAPGMIARMFLRVPGAFDPEPPIPALRWTGSEPDRITDARKRVLRFARDGMAWSRSGLAQVAGVSPSVIDGLSAQGVFEPAEIPPQPVVFDPDVEFGKSELSEEQADIAATLVERSGNGFSVSLIDGVTGSGKTEVYFEAVASAIERRKQVLILLPEIALTQAFLERFEKRFGARPAEWHSGVAPRMREKVWRQVAEGNIRVVAGARSALFLPYSDPGLIVVDEEHDSAYKQEDGVCYNARDMAVVRGHIGGFPVVLASATPSIESRVNAERGRYELLSLPNRFSGAELPRLEAIDLRKNPPSRGKFLSPVMIGHLRDTLEREEQSLLFLNRRGYAPLTLCRVCGHRFQCPDCSSWLVEHRFRGEIVCHHCGYKEGKPEACPECGTFDHLVACGPGIERIAEEVDEMFPQARTLILSSDLPGGVKRMRLELEAIADGAADIVIGTQLVAKGHNFPGMTLVGVVDADIGLSNADPRAAERTFQLLSQVTGRAGRFGKESRGLIQTYQPDHPVLNSIISADREAFYRREIAERERAHLPPFARLAGIVVSATDKAAAEIHARALRKAAPPATGIEVLGPAEAPLALVRSRYRYRLLVHGNLESDIQHYIRQMTAAAPKPRGSVRISIDIDPLSFL